MTDETRNDIRINSRIQFIGPVIVFVSLPITLIALFVFGVYAVYHWSDLIGLSSPIIHGVLILVASVGGILACSLLLHKVIKPLTEIVGNAKKHKVLHTSEHYAIVLDRGEARLIPVSVEKYNYNIRQVESQQETPLQIEAPKAQVLPTYVRYEDIRHQIPQGHTLVGLSERGVESKEEGIKALIWFVGASGTGKTNSVTLRVEEDDSNGYRLLVIDPHIFKDDSLYNAVKGYAHRFLLPVASEPEDILRVLDFFLNEFTQRKAGATWSHPIRIIVDEVGSLTSDIDKDNPQEVEIVRKLKEVVRICGQESRGFKMGGFFISQDAAGLAWLRKRALMVVAHQMMMWSERLLVCNQNTEVARDMDTWPIGRTLIYGIGFKEGQRVFQQPVHSPRIVESVLPHMEDLPRRPFPLPEQSGNSGNANGNTWETAPEADTDGYLKRVVSISSIESGLSTKQKNTEVGNETRETIRRMANKGMALREIAQYVGLSGRKYPTFQEICRELGIVQVDQEAL